MYYLIPYTVLIMRQLLFSYKIRQKRYYFMSNFMLKLIILTSSKKEKEKIEEPFSIIIFHCIWLFIDLRNLKCSSTKKWHLYLNALPRRIRFTGHSNFETLLVLYVSYFIWSFLSITFVFLILFFLEDIIFIMIK